MRRLRFGVGGQPGHLEDIAMWAQLNGAMRLISFWVLPTF